MAAACALAAAACAETPLPAALQSAGPRMGPDDGDLWNLAPSDADAIADVDLEALRASPWSKSLVTGDFGGARAERRRRFGYDVFTEAECLLVVATESGGTPHTLTVARGHFDAARIGSAFLAATPGAAPGSWRDSPLWQGGDRAMALVTPRTLVQGEPDAVRAAIDAAWGLVPDARSGGLGELRRSMEADHSAPAVFFALTVTESTRQRAAGVLDLPPELRRVGGRLDLAADLDLEGIALFDDGHAAAAAASTWTEAARVYARQRMLMLLGLTPIFDGLSLVAEGGRVHARLHVPADKREGLADKLQAVLEMVAAARDGGHP